MLKFKHIFNKNITNNTISRKFSKDNFMKSDNSVYIEQMYENWLQDKDSVHTSWNAYFTNLSNGIESNNAFSEIPNEKININLNKGSSNDALHSKLSAIITKWRVEGHLHADICPITAEYGKINLRSKLKDQIDYDTFKLNENEISKEISFNDISEGFHKSKNKWTAKELNEAYKKIYSGPIGFQFLHIPNQEIRNWIKNRIEKIPHFTKSKEEKLDLLDRIIKSQEFSKICQTKFSLNKRFGIEGLDSTIPGLNHLVNKAGENDVKQLVFGMAHRGRLNSLVNVFGMSPERLFSEMNDNMDKDVDDYVKNFSDDKYYHLNSSYKKDFGNGKMIDISLLPNPSHLETVNPLVMGKARAKMEHLYRNKEKFNLKPDNEEKFIPCKDYVVPIIIHGDAALSGQGIVYECVQMQDLDGYKVGGTINMVFNNLIGFTTDQKHARSSIYSTEVAKVNNSFIIHVNAENPEYVDYAMEIALEFRQKFNLDVYIDIVGYRLFGHNEQDTPAITQPIMYNEINKIKKQPMHEKYYEKIISEGVITMEEIKKIEKKYSDYYNNALEESKKQKLVEEIKESSMWEKLLKRVNNKLEIHDTAFNNNKEIKDLSKKIFTLPEDFKPHSTVKRNYKRWLESVENGKGISWATAEHLAYAKLIQEGYGVRLSGEDVQRGTFGHRHIRISDQNTNKKISPIEKSLISDENRFSFSVYNSLLSEYGVLGYEYGYSLANPNMLTIWEAQFGDFNNVAQPIIDQYIVSAERKWKYFSGLTMFLPHGIDGLGPEHSSCRIERFLQMVDDDYYNDDLYEDRQEQQQRVNMQVCNITKPSNLFHCLRRQLFRNFRKPLIIATPKKLLNLPENVSNIDEFILPNRFKRMIDEDYLEEVNSDFNEIKRVLVCSGQFYFDLLNKRREVKDKNTVIIRIEQIAPFTYSQFINILKNYPNSEVYYCQEEHMNSGSFEYLKPRINRCLVELGKPELKYIGRKPLASPSEGTQSKYLKSLNEILNKAFPK